jgi:hypothetical protein
MTTAEFLTAAVTAAEDAIERGAPIHPHAAAAHAAVESAYGKSGLAIQARNLFGAKAAGQHTAYWAGEFVEMPTWEVVNGHRVNTIARFRAYASLADCFMDYGDIIRRVYPNARADDAIGFLAGLFLTGPRRWATDPLAFEKSARVLGQHYAIIHPLERGASGRAATLVLHMFSREQRVALLVDGAPLRGRFVWRARGDKLDVRAERVGVAAGG